MALSSRSFPIESVADPVTREALRLLWDRVHELERRAPPAGPEDVLTQTAADARYQLRETPNQTLQDRAVSKLQAAAYTPLTEAEARSLL